MTREDVENHRLELIKIRSAFTDKVQNDWNGLRVRLLRAPMTPSASRREAKI